MLMMSRLCNSFIIIIDIFINIFCVEIIDNISSLVSFYL